jgi:hypothetical protein
MSQVRTALREKVSRERVGAEVEGMFNGETHGQALGGLHTHFADTATPFVHSRRSPQLCFCGG